MRCCIFGAGDYRGEMLDKTEGALLLAADGGLLHTEHYRLTPHFIIGDFDSLGTLPKGANVIRHPVMKDETDMALAVEKGLEAGCDEFFLFGSLGGRLDHTLANMSLLLSLAQKGVCAYLVGEKCVITAMCGKKTLVFDGQPSGTISLFAAGGKARGVTLKGLLYNLEKGTITPDFALGVSNAFTERAATVSLDEGALYLMWERVDNPLPMQATQE